MSGDNVELNFEWALKNGDLDQVKAIASKDRSVINKLLPGGRYALCLAADYGQIETISYLLSSGADVNVSDKYGISPLLSAIYEGHTECVKLLLQKDIFAFNQLTPVWAGRSLLVKSNHAGASKSGKAPDGSSYVECAPSDDIKKLLV